MAYMEYLHKEDLQGPTETKFHCSAHVVCFDVSPQSDYMVCECDNNTIQLWSLHTGKQLWARDVKVGKKYFVEEYLLTRSVWYFDKEDGPSPSFTVRSFYRSVVFHPTENLVLPGILSHAYSFDGDLKPFFLSSKCRFSVCSVSADKIKMLTDCPNDAKSVILWSLRDGLEINRFSWSHDILSFAWSRDGRLLAISDLSSSLTLVDVMDGYRTLAQTTISEACRLIKFSPDCRCLYCVTNWDRFYRCELYRLDVNMENDGNFSLDVFSDQVSYQPGEFESRSETGFLLGDSFWVPWKRDPLFPPKPELFFALNEQSALRVASSRRTIVMFQLDEGTKDNRRGSETTAWKVVFSLNGDTLFVITETNRRQPKLTSWDISSGMFKPGKRVIEDPIEPSNCKLVVVREGALVEAGLGRLELWNFELTECIRYWGDLEIFLEIFAISEERVALENKGRTVTILDTTRQGILSTITVDGIFVACNSKCHVITTDHENIMQMRYGDKVLWKMTQPFESRSMSFHTSQLTFSPTEQYFVLTVYEGFLEVLCVLDVDIGKTLRTLQPYTHDLPYLLNIGFKFVSDEECVACFNCLDNHFLQLFNVKSGDLLSEIILEREVYSLSACLRNGLIAIGFKDFKVLQVKLPGDKHSRKSERSGFIKKEQSYNTMTSTEPPERF